jgi:hypothetical protein
VEHRPIDEAGEVMGKGQREVLGTIAIERQLVLAHREAV